MGQRPLAGYENFEVKAEIVPLGGINVKIGVVTIYEAISNLGSYLQAYALQTALREMGHEVYFVQKVSAGKAALRCVLRLNPKREFFLRFLKCGKFLSALRKFCTVPEKKMEQADFDCLIYGSDEIWNMENPYFKDPLFFGTKVENVPRIAYAASIGAMEEETLQQNEEIAKGLFGFNEILVRDDRTQDMIGRYTNRELSLVCDPTFLVPRTKLQNPVKIPNKKYLLVYTYGLDQPMIDNLVRFARERDLQIVSPCFWHPWCDKVIECSPLQFGSLMEHAEYVFTSTFHGAIFAMLNHKQCAILPVRSKVLDVVKRMGAEQHIVSADVSYDVFLKTMEQPFPELEFEGNVEKVRAESKLKLEGALRCLEK